MQIESIEFLKSNYYQAKIYQALDNKKRNTKPAIYLDNFEKWEFEPHYRNCSKL
jgi:hypothetical protein